MSTRRTYEAITKALHDVRPRMADRPDYRQGFANAAAAVADGLAKESPNFDRERFLRDAGGGTTAPPADPAANRAQRLQRFGETVLRIMAEDDQWSSDTLQAVADLAHAEQLAGTALDGTFMVRL